MAGPFPDAASTLMCAIVAERLAPQQTGIQPIYQDDILFLEWSAEGGGNRIQNAVDTFVFRDGLIRVQTVRYTLQPAR